MEINAMSYLSYIKKNRKKNTVLNSIILFDTKQQPYMECNL